MSPMQSLSLLKKDHPAILSSLTNKRCIISLNDTSLYEGRFTTSAIDRYIYEYDETTQAKVLIDVTIDEDNHFLMTLEENPYISSSKDIIREAGGIDNLDGASYCRLINEGVMLPLLPTCESNDSISKIKAIIEADGDMSQDSDGDPNSAPLGTEGAQKDDVAKRESDVKFTIWEAPDKQVDWLKDEDKYLKIEYVYDDKKSGVTIDFLLGKKDGTWQLYAGKKGSVCYDDDPIKDLKKKTFKDGILAAIEFVTDFIKKVEENPDDWDQFYVHQ